MLGVFRFPQVTSLAAFELQCLLGTPKIFYCIYRVKIKHIFLRK